MSFGAIPQEALLHPPNHHLSPPPSPGSLAPSYFEQKRKHLFMRTWKAFQKIKQLVHATSRNNTFLSRQRRFCISFFTTVHEPPCEALAKLINRSALCRILRLQLRIRSKKSMRCSITLRSSIHCKEMKWYATSYSKYQIFPQTGKSRMSWTRSLKNSRKWWVTLLLQSRLSLLSKARLIMQMADNNALGLEFNSISLQCSISGILKWLKRVKVWLCSCIMNR